MHIHTHKANVNNDYVSTIYFSVKLFFMGILLRVIKKIKRGNTGIIHTRLQFGLCRPKNQVYAKCGGTREEGHKSAPARPEL